MPSNPLVLIVGGGLALLLVIVALPALAPPVIDAVKAVRALLQTANPFTVIFALAVLAGGAYWVLKR